VPNVLNFGLLNLTFNCYYLCCWCTGGLGSSSIDLWEKRTATKDRKRWRKYNRWN